MKDSYNLSSLKKTLSSRQLNMLKAYIEDETVYGIVKKYGVKRENIFLEFIYLGKMLATFEWLQCKLPPPIDESDEFIRGFYYCLKLLKGVTKNGIKKEKIKRTKKLSKEKRAKGRG
jgi:hypothetical protein